MRPLRKIKGWAQSHSPAIRHIRVFLANNFVIVMLLGIAFFAYQNAGFQRDNKFLLESAKTNAERDERIVKDTNQIVGDLEKAVNDLKADNERQTLIIQCLLVVHGETQFVSDEATLACQHIQDDAESLTPTKPTQPTQRSAPPVSFRREASTHTHEPEGPKPEPKPEAPPAPAPAESPSLAESVVGLIDLSVIKPVLDILGGDL